MNIEVIFLFVLFIWCAFPFMHTITSSAIYLPFRGSLPSELLNF